MATLADIRSKVRRITKSPSPNQLTDAQIDSYVNTFYLYDFPEHLRLINLKETYRFVTQSDIDQYNFTPNTIISIEPPIYIGGMEIQFFQSRQQFFSVYPEIATNEILTTGSGIAGPYSGNITAAPVKRNRVLISTIDNTGNSLSAQDNGAGTFTGNVLAGSTINYTTGAIAALTWSAIIANGTDIRVQSVSYEAARPQGALFYNDVIQLSPVPNQAYQFEMNCYVTPTSLVNAIDEPELREWWQLLSYGTSLKIFEDRLDMESFAKVQILFDQAKNLVERRTLKQISLNRTATIYTDEFNYVSPYRSNQ